MRTSECHPAASAHRELAAADREQLAAAAGAREPSAEGAAAVGVALQAVGRRAAPHVVHLPALHRLLLLVLVHQQLLVAREAGLVVQSAAAARLLPDCLAALLQASRSDELAL